MKTLAELSYACSAVNTDLVCLKRPSSVPASIQAEHRESRVTRKEQMFGGSLLDKNIRSSDENRIKLTSEPWPEDAKLYQPYEVEQILLPDTAACLSVKAFLRMCDLSFQVEMRTNADSMSPSGSVPFLRCGNTAIADVEPIIEFVQYKGISLSSHLDNAGKADMKAYISLVNIVLRNAELYISWCDNTTLQEVTKPRFTSFLPWPVSHIICWQTKNDVKKRLKSADWHSKSLEDVYEMVDNCCHALSERLGTGKYFFGDKPTELDAVVFGHLFAVLTTPLPDNKLCTILREYQNLVDLCQHIDVNYFQKHAEENTDIERLEMQS